jgi:hypothetical protein
MRLWGFHKEQGTGNREQGTGKLVGWVEGRNPTPPTILSLMLGFTSFNPTYKE